MCAVACFKLHIGVARESCVNDVVMSYFHFAVRAIATSGTGVGYGIVSCHPFERLFHGHPDMIVIVGDCTIAKLKFALLDCDFDRCAYKYSASPFETALYTLCF